MWEVPGRRGRCGGPEVRRRRGGEVSRVTQNDHAPEDRLAALREEIRRAARRPRLVAAAVKVWFVAPLLLSGLAIFLVMRLDARAWWNQLLEKWAIGIWAWWYHPFEICVIGASASWIAAGAARRWQRHAIKARLRLAPQEQVQQALNELVSDPEEPVRQLAKQLLGDSARPAEVVAAGAPAGTGAELCARETPPG